MKGVKSGFRENSTLTKKEDIFRIISKIKEKIKNCKQNISSDNSLAKPSDIDELRDKFVNLHLLSKFMCRNKRRPVFQSLLGISFVRKAYLKFFPLTPEEKEFYEEITEYTRSGYSVAEKTNDKAKGFLMVIFQKILTSSTYALHRSLLNRKGKLESKLGKIDKEISKKQNNEFGEILEGAKEGSEVENRLDEISSYEQITKEDIKKELEKLEHLIQKAKKLVSNSIDTKIVELEKLLDEIFEKNYNEKVLIFTQFLGSQKYLYERLLKKYKVVIYNGTMKEEEKNKFLEIFKNEFQIMISTEVGGEGGNFQFCHIMVNYDLPWNPMRIEQRIGRLDRIGQKKDVEIYNFAVQDTIEGRIVEVLQNRIKIFETSIGSLDPILGETEKKWTEIVMKQDRERLERWGKDWELKLRKRRETDEKLQDFVMDLKSFRKDFVQNVILPKYEQEKVNPMIVKELVIQFLERFPSSKINQTNAIYDIELPEAFLEDTKRIFNKRIEKIYRVTFDQEIAKEKEEIEFCSFGHPLFDAILEYCQQLYFIRGENPILFGGIGIFRVTNSPPPFSDRTGFLFSYLLKIISPLFNESKEVFIPIFVNIKEEYEEIFSENFLREVTPVNVVSLKNEELEEFERCRNQIEKFREKAENIAIEKRTRELENFKSEIGKVYNIRKNSIDNNFRFRIAREGKELSRFKDMLKKYEEEGVEDERKLIPATKGKISKAEKRKEKLQKDWDRQISGLENDKNCLSDNLELVNMMWLKT